MVQRDQWDTYWGPKKISFLIRDIDGPAMTAASVESCRCGARRSPRGRLGSVLYTFKRLRRMRRRFKHFWPISHNWRAARPSDLAYRHTRNHIYLYIHVYRARRMSFENKPLRLTRFFLAIEADLGIDQWRRGTSGSREGLFLGCFEWIG